MHFHSRKCIWKCRLRNGGYFVSASGWLKDSSQRSPAMGEALQWFEVTMMVENGCFPVLGNGTWCLKSLVLRWRTLCHISSHLSHIENRELSYCQLYRYRWYRSFCKTTTPWVANDHWHHDDSRFPVNAFNITVQLCAQFANGCETASAVTWNGASRSPTPVAQNTARHFVR